jgi:hypothetical protein
MQATPYPAKFRKNPAKKPEVALRGAPLNRHRGVIGTGRQVAGNFHRICMRGMALRPLPLVTSEEPSDAQLAGAHAHGSNRRCQSGKPYRNGHPMCSPCALGRVVLCRRRSITSAQCALHQNRVDPLTELETDATQGTDRLKSQATM